jgi:hypothetical protein
MKPYQILLSKKRVRPIKLGKEFYANIASINKALA